MEDRNYHAETDFNLNNKDNTKDHQTCHLKSFQSESFDAHEIFAGNATEVKNESHNDVILLDEGIAQDDVNNRPTNNDSPPNENSEGPAGLSPDANTSKDKEVSERSNTGRVKRRKLSRDWVCDSTKKNLTVDILEDDRFKLDLPSKVNWAEFVPKLREPQSYELEPTALNLIHKTYTNLIDLKDTIQVFTTSQFLQLLSIYLPFLRFNHSGPKTAYLYCSGRLKCKSAMLLKLDKEKGLFYLLYNCDPAHTHKYS
ncbi:unnamed protein product [Ambrosiozyma monospora]|uniref:Unnamed protein product n=1 Tax=Ambrosiozyma monospora TaxID=43982 RepID=A0ACB5T9P5_AMBMO|nr:unnamed protein product [Ambrosiozyma monospora]